MHNNVNERESDSDSYQDSYQGKDQPFFIKAILAISTVAGWISAAMILLAVFITCQMIFVRFVLNQSTAWQTETVIYLMIAATLIGLSFVQKVRGHVNVDLIPLLLPLKARFYLAAFTLLLSALIIAVMTWYGFEYWHIALKKNWVSDTVTEVPLWIPYLALPVGLGLFFLQLMADFFSLILKIESPFWLKEK